jgi:hypothetical protein
MNEYEATVALANRILDRPGGTDPDDDLAMLSRQLLRSIERAAALEAENTRLRDVLRKVADWPNIGGLPCFCSYDPDSDHDQHDHYQHCKNARAALAQPGPDAGRTKE